LLVKTSYNIKLDPVVNSSMHLKMP